MIMIIMEHMIMKENCPHMKIYSAKNTHLISLNIMVLLMPILCATVICAEICTGDTTFYNYSNIKLKAETESVGTLIKL